MDRDRSEFGGFRSQWQRADAAMECTGIALQRSDGDLYRRIGGDWRRCQDGMRADCAECAVDTGTECEQDEDGHDADAVFLKFAAGRNSAGLAASLYREQAGVSDERYSAA